MRTANEKSEQTKERTSGIELAIDRMFDLVILPADQLRGDASDLTQLRNLDFVSDIIRTHVALWFCHLPTS